MVTSRILFNAELFALIARSFSLLVVKDKFMVYINFTLTMSLLVGPRSLRLAAGLPNSLRLVIAAATHRAFRTSHCVTASAGSKPVISVTPILIVKR